MGDMAADPKQRACYRCSRRRARTGDIDAWEDVVRSFRWGCGVRKDLRRALRLVEAEWRRRRHPVVANQGAFVCEEMGDAEGETLWLRRAAEAGHANCMVALGYRLRYGIAAPLDPAAAGRWYRRAARLGDAEAWMNLAICHKQGIGAPKDPKREEYCLDRAAALGSERAELRLIAAIADGRFGVTDPDLAESQMRELARTYAPAAEELTDRLLSGVGLRRDVAGALRILRRHARSGAGWAWLTLGVGKFNGKWMRKDVRGAIAAYRKAARAGEARAWFNLGLCHRDGTGFPRSQARALACFERAASMGDEEAAVLAAQHHLDERAGPRGAERAASILRRVRDEESPEALVLLARLLRDGKGVARDLDEARGLLRIAASLGHDVTAELRALRAAARRGRTKVPDSVRRARKV